MTPQPIHIVVPGAIVPWQRAQRNRLKSGAVVSFTRPDVEAYHGVVRLAASEVMGERPPFDCALELSLLAVFAVPASWSGKRKREALAGIIHKTTRPDLENSVKGALDALQSIVYRDDCQVVCYASCAKIYGERPRLEITIAPIAAPVLPDARAVERQREPADLFAGATP